MGLQWGIPATFTGFQLSPNRERRKPPPHDYTCCKQKCSLPPIPATQGAEHPLHVVESVADQLCILVIYLKNYTLAGMPLCLWRPRILSILDTAFLDRNLCFVFLCIKMCFSFNIQIKQHKCHLYWMNVWVGGAIFFFRLVLTNN